MTFFKQVILLIGTILLTAACNDDYDEPWIFVDDTYGKDYKLYDPYRDVYGNEGVVAYIEEDTSFRYIMVLSLDESTTSWGPTGETIFKGDPDSSVYNPQFGLAMLQCMVSRGIQHFPAQKWCYEKNNGEDFPSTGSWRMPSYIDYYLMLRGDFASDLDSINIYMAKYGGKPLSKTDYYWCCEEDYEGYYELIGTEQNYDPDNRAVMTTLEFKSSGDKDFWIKKTKHKVRAVKVICYKYL